MALRKRKPTSPARRFQTVSDFADVTKDNLPGSAKAAAPVATEDAAS
jgi:large subunit ribosomal protein L2